MLPDRVSNPGPLAYESGALPIALRGPAEDCLDGLSMCRLTAPKFRSLIVKPCFSLLLLPKSK